MYRVSQRDRFYWRFVLTLLGTDDEVLQRIFIWKKRKRHTVMFSPCVCGWHGYVEGLEYKVARISTKRHFFLDFHDYHEIIDDGNFTIFFFSITVVRQIYCVELIMKFIWYNNVNFVHYIVMQCKKPMKSYFQALMLYLAWHHCEQVLIIFSFYLVIPYGKHERHVNLS